MADLTARERLFDLALLDAHRRVRRSLAQLRADLDDLLRLHGAREGAVQLVERASVSGAEEVGRHGEN